MKYTLFFLNPLFNNAWIFLVKAILKRKKAINLTGLKSFKDTCNNQISKTKILHSHFSLVDIKIN